MKRTLKWHSSLGSFAYVALPSSVYTYPVSAWVAPQSIKSSSELCLSGICLSLISIFNSFKPNLIYLASLRLRDFLFIAYNSAMSHPTTGPLPVTEERELLLEALLGILKRCQGSGCSLHSPSPMDGVRGGGGQMSEVWPMLLFHIITLLSFQREIPI